MNFNLNEYYIENQKLKDIVRKSCSNLETNEGFFFDGLFCPDIYEKQAFKLLIVLAETYGYEDDGNIEDEFDSWSKPSRYTATVAKIATLVWLIYKSINERSIISWNNFPDLFGNSNWNIIERKEALSKIGWINVKKKSREIPEWSAGATRADSCEIYQSCKSNKEILIRQIQSIVPDLIVVCSDPVFNGLYDNNILGNGLEKGKKWQIQKNNLGQFMIQVSHPSYFKEWGYEGIYNLYKTIYYSVLSDNDKKFRNDLAKLANELQLLKVDVDSNFGQYNSGFYLSKVEWRYFEIGFVFDEQWGSFFYGICKRISDIEIPETLKSKIVAALNSWKQSDEPTNNWSWWNWFEKDKNWNENTFKKIENGDLVNEIRDMVIEMMHKLEGIEL